jgi:hypothetical protein
MFILTAGALSARQPAMLPRQSTLRLAHRRAARCTGACLIRLRAARSGLPPALVALKAGLEAAHAGLPRENPGSRWPKVTLGVLGDARRLLPDQLARLNALCACAPPPASCVRGQG